MTRISFDDFFQSPPDPVTPLPPTQTTEQDVTPELVAEDTALGAVEEEQDEVLPSPSGPVVPAGAGQQSFDSARRRYEGHSPLNDLVREDWIKVIEISPDRFDALLYRAIPPAEPAPEQKGYEQNMVGVLSVHQQELSYDSPVWVPVLDCPDEMQEFNTVDSDDDGVGVPDSVLILRIGSTGIPRGSILEFEEEINNGEYRRAWWYVLDIHNYGTVGVGSLYYCVPCRSFEGILDGSA